MVREVLTNDTFASCSWPKYVENDNYDGNQLGKWYKFSQNNDRISKGCVIDAWLNKAAETKWVATNLLGTTLLKYGIPNDSPYLTFTRTTYTV